MSKIWFETRIALPERISRSEDVMCSFAHVFGLGMALSAAIPLVFEAVGSRRDLWVVLVYSLSICLVFAVSAIYHGLSPSTAKRVFRFIDHNVIYVLIAGTYTPYVSGMGNSGRSLLIIIWMLAAVNIVVNILFWNRFKIFHLFSYLCMGWFIVFFWKDLRLVASLRQIWWMLTGGFLYTMGVFFYVKMSIPWAHFIWHLFVIGGAAGLHVGITLR